MYSPAFILSGMGRPVVFTGTCLVTLALASCAPSERNLLVQQRQTELKAFKPVSYSRRLDETEEKIAIAADGSFTRTRTIAVLKGKLSEFQVMQLKRLFDDWGKLNAKYPAAAESDTAGVTTITYGDKTVTASDRAIEIPETFMLIRRSIEQYTYESSRAATAEGAAAP